MSQYPPFAAQVGQPQQNACVYVGNLDQSVTDISLMEFFGKVGPVKMCKLVRGTQGTHAHPYGFVEYHDSATAAAAIQTLNGQVFNSNELKVNWAQGGAIGAHGNTHPRSPSNFHMNGAAAAANAAGAMGSAPSGSGGQSPVLDDLTVFVGDLAPDVTDAMLSNAFAQFGGVVDARVIQDGHTGKSKGYGFVSFRVKADAERAMMELNGKWIGSRPVRTNWAARKGANGNSNASGSGSGAGPHGHMHPRPRSQFDNGGGAYGHRQYFTQAPPMHGGKGMPGGSAPGQSSGQHPGSHAGQHPGQPLQKLNYDVVVAQTSQYNTTVYVGGIGTAVTDNLLREQFVQFGYIMDVRINREKLYAFVRFTTHDSAARAIVAMNGSNLGGRVVKCSWGKEPNYGVVAAVMPGGDGYNYYSHTQMPFFGQYGYAPTMGGAGAYGGPRAIPPHQFQQMVAQQQAAIAAAAQAQAQAQAHASQQLQGTSQQGGDAQGGAGPTGASQSGAQDGGVSDGPGHVHAAQFQQATAAAY